MVAQKGSNLTSVYLLLALGLFVFLQSVFVIYEGQQGIILRLGKIRSTQGLLPGIHFKMPFIESAKVYDVRLRSFDGNSSRILTSNQKYVLVDYYAKWKIKDVPLYYTRTGGITGRAHVLLKQKINDSLRQEFGERTISEVVTGERVDIINILREKANISAARLGIEIADVRIRQIDLPNEVRMSVFQRMSAEREQVAAQHRSQGQAKAEEIRATADKKATVIVANENAKAAHRKAEGDAKAAVIYNKSYSQDSAFYKFWQALHSYTESFSAKDVVILSPDGDFFKTMRKFTN